MPSKSIIGREQAIQYINARLCRLGEQKRELLQNGRCMDEHISYQIKIIDWKMDTLLERLAGFTGIDGEKAA